MSDDYGLFVNPKDGGKPIEITNKTFPLSFIKEIMVDPWSGDKNNKVKSFNIPGLSKYDVVIVPMSTCHFLEYGYVSKTLVSRWWVDGDIFRCEYSQISWNGGWLPGNNGKTYFMLFGTLKDVPKNTYGLFINGLDGAIDNFRGITQESDLSYCVFREKIRLTDRQKWSIPTTIPNRDSVCVFMRPVSSSHVLRYDRASKQVWSWGSGDVYIVIFSYGLDLQPADGLTIWNSAGKVTYSSDYVPFVKNGHQLTLNKNSATSSFAVPMFTFDTPSAWVVEERNSYNIFAGGYKVSGNRLIGARLWTIGSYPIYTGSSMDIYDQEIIFGGSYAIDFNDYF